MPTTTNNGWTIPADTDLVKNGASAIRTLGNAIDSTLGVYTPSTPGLTFISSTTIGSAVSSVSVNDVFSSTYKNYKIVMNVDAFSATTTLLMRMRVSGSDNSSSNYMYAAYEGITSSPFTDGISSTSDTSWSIHRYTRSNGSSHEITVFRPFSTNYTDVRGFATTTNEGFARPTNFGGSMTVTTSYTGFTIFPTSGTMTGGTIKVYGIKD